MRTQFFPVLLLFFSGCCGVTLYEYDGERHYVADRTNVKEEEENHCARGCKTDLLLDDSSDIDFSDQYDWEQRVYETVDEWHDRIECDLAIVEDEINLLRTQVSDLLYEEQKLAKRIQQLVIKNESLRRCQLTISGHLPYPSGFKNTEKSPEFRVHVVRPGETLYRIAIDQYGNPDMVDRILSWNQNWIKEPTDLIAGYGLVLFSEDYDGVAEEDIKTYIEDLDSEVI